MTGPMEPQGKRPEEDKEKSGQFSHGGTTPRQSPKIDVVSYAAGINERLAVWILHTVIQSTSERIT